MNHYQIATITSYIVITKNTRTSDKKIHVLKLHYKWSANNCFRYFSLKYLFFTTSNKQILHLRLSCIISKLFKYFQTSDFFNLSRISMSIQEHGSTVSDVHSNYVSKLCIFSDYLVFAVKRNIYVMKHNRT